MLEVKFTTYVRIAQATIHLSFKPTIDKTGILWTYIRTYKQNLRIAMRLLFADRIGNNHKNHQIHLLIKIYVHTYVSRKFVHIQQYWRLSEERF